MNRTRKTGLIAAGLLAAASTIAIGAGNYSTYPIVGQNSFCVSSVTGAGAPFSGATGQGQGTTGSICAQTVPAGPAQTGEELVPADTQAAGPTQTVTIPSSLLGGYNNRVNRLIGGDFGTNLWQRGTTPVSASTSETSALMTADRWWIQGPTSSATQVTVSKQTGATDSIPASGFYASMRVARPSAQTGTGIICIGQTLDKQAASELLGNNAVFSFYANTGANFSPTNGSVTAQVAYFTAADGSAAQSAVGAAGTNGLTSALSIAGQTGGIAGFVDATAGTSPGFTSGTLASGVVTIPTAAAGTWTRYSVYAPIPSTNASGTAVTGVVVGLCWTPVGTAGTNDWIEFTGMQLQSQSSGVTNSLPSGVITPTGFERRAPEAEARLQYYYSYVVNEGALGPSRSVCHFTTANTAMQCPIVYPVPMRIAPVVKYATGFAGFTTTAETTANECTGNTTDATVALTASTSQVMMQCAIASGTTAAVGLSMTLIDNGSTGVISASAEP